MNISIEVEEEDLIPVYATEGASGADVRAHLTAPITIQPGDIAIIPTGIRASLPQGVEIQVRPRSGLAAKFGVTVLNAPGTVDADYRGEIKVILINHGKQPFVVEPKMRIAQLVIATVEQAQFTLGELLTNTMRGAGGFGHTGTK